MSNRSEVQTDEQYNEKTASRDRMVQRKMELDRSKNTVTGWQLTRPQVNLLSAGNCRY